MDDHDVISQAEFDEEILTFDVSDEALERTASLSGKRSLGYIALSNGSTARLNSARIAAFNCGSLAMLARVRSEIDPDQIFHRPTVFLITDLQHQEASLPP
jgi:hypothetical protein